MGWVVLFLESNGFYHWLPPHGNKIRLEAYTEQSESNPGRSLGIYKA